MAVKKSGEVILELALGLVVASSGAAAAVEHPAHNPGARALS
ncbi:hypothetical protein [Novosphingobium sp.]|nr:hypothetical protein [Novosphingobium sp.]HKR93038.1 hypothetical protein [Novosphingobium sp.]